MAVTNAVVAAAIAVAPGLSTAMVVTHDEAAFLKMFTSPTEAIDFTHLIDGRTFDNADTSPYVRQMRQPPLSYLVMQNGWSNHVNIGSTTLGCQCAWQAVSWLAPGIIAPDFYGSLYVELLGDLGPIALGSGANFTGLIPEDDSDRYYALGVAGTFASIRLGFTPVETPQPSVPEPTSFALLISALAASLVTARRTGHCDPAIPGAAVHQ